MPKLEVALGILGVLFLVALLLLAVPVSEETVGIKTLKYYEPKGFGKPSYAIFDDGSYYMSIRFIGEIRIGAKYRIVKIQNIYHITIECRAIIMEG